jgi:Concanavalin A-like lectin/glucanases superfamily/Carbohydrate family 9 binding domain-like
MIARLLCICTALLCLAQPAVATVDTIIPAPKSLKVIGKPVMMKGFRIAIADTERASIGAAEINQRITSLGGKALPVISLTASLPKGKLIVIAPCTDKGVKQAKLEVSPEKPGPQGYVIVPQGSGDNQRLWLVGSDSIGTLYAAATCRRLIAKQGGALTLQPVTVRDWPDFKSRMNGVAFADSNLRVHWYGLVNAERKGDVEKAKSEAEKWVVDQKEYFDFMLRAKMNMVWFYTNIRPADTDPKSLPIARSAMKEVTSYGLARGIESVTSEKTHIGKERTHRNNPDFKEVIHSRSHKSYFCWSRLDIHRRQAANAARWVKDGGFKGFYIHATDSGNWRNPALWQDRCSKCRKMYGNDHAKADATVFRIYYDAIKALVPDVKFTVVVYPYNSHFVSPDGIYKEVTLTMGAGPQTRLVADKARERLIKFMGRLDKLLPKDIYVCVRESDRQNFEHMRKAWGGKRRFLIYFEYANWRGLRPNLIMTPLMTKSMYFPEHDDILYGNVSPMAWREMTQLLGAECSWNVNVPRSRDFVVKGFKSYGLLSPLYPERKAFSVRAARYMFGEEAGPLMAPAFGEDISRAIIDMPEMPLKHYPSLDMPDILKKQAAASERALVSLGKLWDLQARKPVLDDWGMGYFLNTYQATAGAYLLAGHRSHIFAAKDALGKGDAKKFDAELKAARAWLVTAGPKWEAIDRKIPRDQLLRHYNRRGWVTDSRLVNVRVADLRKELDVLEGRRGELRAVVKLPRWFGRYMSRKRILQAIPAKGDMVIDGQLDEPIWKDAPPIDHFVSHKKLKLESLETRGRLLYTPKTLYVAFECYDPDPAGISTAFPKQDEYAFCDSVEVFVALARNSREHLHWIIDSKGGVYDVRAVKNDEGVIKNNPKWNSKAKVAVKRLADRWVVEMAIPAKDLNMTLKPGEMRKVLLARNIIHTLAKGEEESNAVVFLKGARFNAVDKYPHLILSPAKAPKTPVHVALRLRKMTLANEMTGTGTATRATGALTIESTMNLHNVTVRGFFTNGSALLGSKELVKADAIRVARTERFSTSVPGEHRGLTVRFDVVSDEGTWSFTRRFGSPKQVPIADKDIYGPNVGGGKGGSLAAPAFFPSSNPATITLEQGTIEFWVQPRSDFVPYASVPGDGLRNAFFYMGPVRPDYAEGYNRESFLIGQTSYPSIHTIATNDKYHQRLIYGYNRGWKKGEWHHVALQWDFDDKGKTMMALYLDGKLASDKCLGSSKSPSSKPLIKRAMGFPIQLGAMNTGYAPANAFIDEFRISRTLRYKGAFTPAKRHKPDSSTVTLFHFDGNLKATVPAGLEAQPGIAQCGVSKP